MPVQQRGDDEAGLCQNFSSLFPFVVPWVLAPFHCETPETAEGQATGGPNGQAQEGQKEERYLGGSAAWV